MVDVIGNAPPSGRDAAAGEAQSERRAPALGRFVFVMGTGVISLSLSAAGIRPLSFVFLGIAVAGYLELVIIEGLVILRRPRSLLASFATLRASLGAFTFAVGTLVLASSFAQLTAIPLAFALLILGGAAAVALAYLVPVNALWRHFPTGRLGSGGGLWLLWPVALDATSVAASSISATGRFAGGALAVLAVGAWTLGIALYLPLLAALLGRLVLRDVPLREIGPSYWVTMGAAALSCLAAAHIGGNPATRTDLDRGLATMAVEASWLLWFLATALLPVVLGLSIARTRFRSQLVGSPKELWVPVFPAAMYALATRTLGLTTDVRWLAILGGWAVWLGVAVFIVEVFRAVRMLLLPER